MGALSLILAALARHGLLAGLALMAGIVFWAPVMAQTLRGSVAATGALHPHAALLSGQPKGRLVGSTTLRLEGATPIAEDTEAVFSGRTTLAENTSDLLFGDVGEGFIEHRTESLSFRIGVLDERWGVLDAANPANIVNQLDLVADYQGDQRLGQPGFLARWLGERLTLSAMVLPFNRLRRLAEDEDRLRFAELPFADAKFENGAFSPSYAVRGFWQAGEVEFALSHFHGTSREPEFALDVAPGGARLVPTYRRIDQTAAEAQMVLGDYVLRGEAIHRWGQSGRPFFAAGVGVERIFYGVADSAADLQFYTEAYYDDRPAEAPVTPFDNDISIGARLFLNDPASTEISLRATSDLKAGGALVEADARRRIDDDLVLGLSVTAPISVKADPALTNFRRDLRLQLSLTRYF